MSLQSAATDTLGARQELHQVYSWSTVAIAALFAGGLALVAQNDGFRNPENLSHAVVLLTIFVVVIPGVACQSGYIFLTQVARVLQCRLLAEAYEKHLARTLYEKAPLEALVYREVVYFGWKDRSKKRTHDTPRGADVTRNGYVASALIYCLSALGAGVIGVVLVVFSDYLEGRLWWQIAVCALGAAVILAAWAILGLQAFRVRDLLSCDLSVACETSTTTGPAEGAATSDAPAALEATSPPPDSGSG